MRPKDFPKKHHKTKDQRIQKKVERSMGREVNEVKKNQ
jgi:hypothetical protein